MSKLHIMEAREDGQYRVIVHTNTPAGNNSVPAAAGGPVSVKTAVVNSGKNVTKMTVGSGPGQISSAEAAQIASGDVLEFEGQFRAESGGGGAGLLTALNAMADQVITQGLAKLQAELKFFGAAVG